jgi:tetratricopeptide (TPR) repeat protein
VLALQDEIARAITLALTHRLLPSHDTAPAKTAPIDPQAYRDYLLGQQELGPRVAAHTEKAVALFQQATALAPGFAEGFAALGHAYINMAEDHPERHDLIPAADAALMRALALDPKCVSALTAHLDLALHKLDWPTANADARRLHAINPHSAAVLHEMFRYYQLLGFPDLALASARGAAALDPLSFVDRLNVTSALIHNGRFSDAATAAQQALTLAHDQAFVQALLCTAYAHSGQVPAARTIAARFAQAHDDGDAQGCQFDIAIGEGRNADAVRINDQFAAHFSAGGMAATDIGDNYAVAGETAKAVAWFSRAYDAKEFSLFTIAFDRAIQPAFFDQPGWKTLTQKPLFIDWQTAHDAVAEDLAAGKV